MPLLFPCLAWGQAATEARLTQQLCTCITADTLHSLRVAARDCLEDVEERFELDVLEPEEGGALVDSLSVLLARDCPALQAMLARTARAPEWSDRPGAPPFRYRAHHLYDNRARNAGADIGSKEQGKEVNPLSPGMVKEAELDITLSGTLDDLSPDGQLQLATEKGMRVLYLPARVRAAFTWVRGQDYTLNCRQVVSPAADRLIWEVLGVAD